MVRYETPNPGSSYFYNGNGGSGGGGNQSVARTGGSGVFMIRYITP